MNNHLAAIIEVPVAYERRYVAAIIEVPVCYMDEIHGLLFRLTRGIIGPGQTVEQYLGRLAVLVDWFEICFTTGQLRAAVQLIGPREWLTAPPRFWAYPFAQMTAPLGTINSEA